MKHRLFERFSQKPVVFALLVLGELAANAPVGDDGAVPEGQKGYVRTPQTAIMNEDLRDSLLYLDVHRALLLREKCTTGTCLQKGLRLKCNASELGITSFVDEQSGEYSNMCEVQVSRFRDSLEMVRDYEAENNMKFDWVTRARPDVYFTRPAPQALSLDSEKAYFTPWGQCGYGGMDWFYAIPRQHADTVGNFASHVSCSDYKSDPAIAETCNACAGCECWMAAWLHAQKVSFTRLPWAWAAPAKFCGADCPPDWKVTPDSIMGLDSRVANEPCTNNKGNITCPA